MRRQTKPLARRAEGIGLQPGQGGARQQAAQNHLPRGAGLGNIADRLADGAQPEPRCASDGQRAGQMRAPLGAVGRVPAACVRTPAAVGAALGSQVERNALFQRCATNAVRRLGRSREAMVEPLAIPIGQYGVTRSALAQSLQKGVQGKRRAGKGVTGGQDCLVHDRVAGNSPEVRGEAVVQPQRHRRHSRGVLQAHMQHMMPGKAELLMRRECLEGRAVTDLGPLCLGGARHVVPVTVPAPERQRRQCRIRLGRGAQGGGGAAGVVAHSRPAARRSSA